MMREAIYRTLETPKNIEIRSFGGERHGCRRECCLAIEPGAGENAAGQEMSNGLQGNFVTQTVVRCS